MKELADAIIEYVRLRDEGKNVAVASANAGAGFLGKNFGQWLRAVEAIEQHAEQAVQKAARNSTACQEL